MKHRKYKIGLSFLSAMYLSCQIAFADPMKVSLQNCIDLALQSNPSVKIAETENEKSLGSMQQAKSQKGWQISLIQKDQRSDETPSWINKAIYPKVSAYNSFVNEIEATYPIYSGGKLENQIDVAKLTQKNAILNIEKTKQQLTLDVTLAYYDALQRKNLLQNATEAVEDFNAHLDNVQKQFDVGNVAFIDILQTKVKLADAEDKLIQAHNTYDLSIYKLNMLMQLPLHNELNLIEPLNSEKYPLSLEESLATAMKNQPEIAEVETNLQIAKKQVDIAKSAKKPSIDINLDQLWWDSKNYPGIKDHNWGVGITVKLDLFDNGLIKSKIQQAESTVKIADQEIKQQKDSIELEINQAYLSMQEAKKREEANQVAIDHAKLNLNLAKIRFDAGLGTNLDLIDAEVSLTEAQNNYTQALYDYDVSQAKLDRAIGRM